MTNDLHLSLEKYATNYCLYQHVALTVDGWVVIWIGVTKLTDLYYFSDAKKNTAWVEMTKNPALLFKTEILETAKNSAQLFNLRTRLIKEKKPYCNLYGVRFGRSNIIRCIETGETFKTQAEAAKANNVHMSALSNHLSGKAGYKTIGGKTFKRETT